jgi:hypothetical protein
MILLLTSFAPTSAPSSHPIPAPISPVVIANLA